MSISVLVNIVLGDGFSPGSSSLKFDVVNVDSGVDDVCKANERMERSVSTACSESGRS